MNVTGEGTVPTILVIYSSESELDPVFSAINSLPFSVIIEKKNFSELSNVKIMEYDIIILLSTTEFVLEDDLEDDLAGFLRDKTKSFLAFSPYLNQLSNEVELLLGYDEIGDLLPEDNVTTWNLQIEQNIGNLSSGDSFSYTGQYAEIGALSYTQNLVTITSISPNGNTNDESQEVEDEGEDEVELNFPVAAIIDATTNGANIISGTLSPISVYSLPSLSLNQIPQIFSSLIGQIYSSFIIQANTSYKNGPFDNNDQFTENLFDQPVPFIPRLQFGNLIFYMILSFIFLLLGKFMGWIDWINRRFIGAGIFVIGIFYNVEDRILDQRDVYLNNSRADIMDYLDNVGKYGSHLREIKSITNLGSGSLIWHLKVLEDFNWIIKYKIENHTVYVSYNFETSFDPHLKKLELRLLSKYSFELFQALSNISFNNSITIIDLQKQTDVPNKAIRRFVNKLVEMEIVSIVNTKPIRFQVYNFSILAKLLESLTLRKTYEKIKSNIHVETDE